MTVDATSDVVPTVEPHTINPSTFQAAQVVDPETFATIVPVKERAPLVATVTWFEMSAVALLFDVRTVAVAFVVV